MSTATEKIAEEQAIHAHKVAQKVGDYHSKVASAPLQLTDNPFADIGIFNKLSPEFRNQIYGCLLEDAPQSDSSGPLCPCHLVPGEHEHTGAEVYKPLGHHLSGERGGSGSPSSSRVWPIGSSTPSRGTSETVPASITISRAPAVKTGELM